MVTTDGPGPRAGSPEPAGISLDGIVLADARTGDPVDFGEGPRLTVLTVIRHRH